MTSLRRVSCDSCLLDTMLGFRHLKEQGTDESPHVFPARGHLETICGLKPERQQYSKLNVNGIHSS